ncbi:MAG: hypothetical protein ACOC83_08470 [Gemmatimonadota bacterium]
MSRSEQMAARSARNLRTRQDQTLTRGLGRAVVVGLLLAAAWVAPTAAQEEAPAPPEAEPADVESIDAIVTALYDVISGPAGEERDVERFRSLFLPGASLVPVSSQTGEPQRITLDEFIESSIPFMEENGFFEEEVASTVERYGHLAQVFSTYASRNETDEPEPFVEGINSITLVFDGERWWVTHIAWNDTNLAGPIPEEYR